jgi:hypothetical protein
VLLQPAIGGTDMSRSSSGRAHTPRDPIVLVTADHRAAAAGSGGVASRVGGVGPAGEIELSSVGGWKGGEKCASGSSCEQMW